MKVIDLELEIKKLDKNMVGCETEEGLIGLIHVIYAWEKYHRGNTLGDNDPYYELMWRIKKARGEMEYVLPEDIKNASKNSPKNG